MSQIYPALSRLLGLTPAGMADTPDLGGEGSPEDDTGAGSQAPERQTLSPDESLRRALEAVPEPTATQLDRPNSGPEPSVPQGNPINPTGPQIYNRNWRGGYDEDNNPYARHANGSFMIGRQAQQLMEMSNGQGWHRQGQGYALGAAPTAEQINAQLTANMPMSQTERMYSQQLQHGMAEVNRRYMANGLTIEQANHALMELQRHYSPIAAREAHEKEQQRQMAHASALDAAGMHGEAERVLRQMRADSLPMSVRAIPTANGPALLVPNDKGGFDEVKPPSGGNEPVTRDERFESEMRDRHTKLQDTLASRRDERDRKDRAEDSDTLMKLEDAAHKHHLEWSRERTTNPAAELPEHLRSHEARMAYVHRRMDELRPGWRERAQLFAARPGPAVPNAGPRPGQPVQPNITGTNIPRQGQAPAGPAQPTPTAQHLAAIDFSRAHAEAGELRSPEDQTTVRTLLGEAQQINQRYQGVPASRIPEDVRRRYAGIQGVIREHLKKPKLSPAEQHQRNNDLAARLLPPGV